MTPGQAQALLPEVQCSRCGAPAIRLMRALVCSDIRCPWTGARFTSNAQARPAERRVTTQAAKKKRAGAQRKVEHLALAEQRRRKVFRVLRSDPWRNTLAIAHKAGVKESSTHAILLDGLGRTTKRARGDRRTHVWALIDERIPSPKSRQQDERDRILHEIEGSPWLTLVEIAERVGIDVQRARRHIWGLPVTRRLTEDRSTFIYAKRAQAHARASAGVGL